jgi:sulfopyruvate decarboxylase subunit beta
MKRIDALRVIADIDALVVCNIGFPSRELYSIADKPTTFYMLGSMGLASSIGLGVARAQKRTVLAVDGDGSVLMNLGTLATIAHYGPSNYHLVIIDNSAYGSTGDQPTFTARKTDLAALARAAGNEQVYTVNTEDGLRGLLRELPRGPTVIVVKTEPGNADCPVVPLTALSIKNRFMKTISQYPEATYP